MVVTEDQGLGPGTWRGHEVVEVSAEGIGVKLPQLPQAEASVDHQSSPDDERDSGAASRMPAHVMPRHMAPRVNTAMSPPISTLPFQLKLKPPSTALSKSSSQGAGRSIPEPSRGRSPERLPAVKAPPQAVRYTWDLDFDRLVRSRMMTADTLTPSAGLIGVLTSAPSTQEIGMEPDAKSLAWFRGHYGAPPPTHRRDAVAVSQWLEGQMLALEKTLEKQQLLPSQRVASPSHAGRTSTSPSRADRNASSPPRNNASSASGGGGAADATTSPHSRDPGPAVGSHFALSDDGRTSILAVRDGDGFLSSAVLNHQEQLLTRGMEELCGQVATICVERGHLMWQLWVALRHMLRLSLQDRDNSRSITREARRTELAALESTRTAQARMKEEVDELNRMNELLNRRVLISKQDADTSKVRVAELEAKLAALANANPAVLQAQIEQLTDTVNINEKQVAALTVKLDSMARDLVDSQREVSYLTKTLSEARAEVTTMAGELGVRTPRPHQPRQPPWELISEEETAMGQAALREGCSALDMHRLMLGVTFNNCNIMPWVETFMGVCRHWVPTSKLTAQGDEAGAGEGGDTSGEGAAEGTSSPNRHASPKRTTSVANLNRMQSMAHTVGAPSTVGTRATGRPGRKSKLLHTAVTPIKELHPQLAKLVAQQNAAVLGRTLSADIVQAVAQMANHGVDPDSIACLLLGSLSPDGAELTQYKALAGILAERFNGTPDDIGGPITESLQTAALSTRERVELLEATVLRQHRTAVKLRRAVVEQRKQAEDTREKEAKLQARKITRRPHPLKALLEQKRAEFFVGLGTGDVAVPQVLQVDGRVYNRAIEKADAERSVHTIWRSKADFEATNDVTISLADYLYVYLHRKHGTPKAICEAAYNLLYTLHQHAYDPDCNLFIKVFMHELDEDTKSQQDQLKVKILELLKSVDQKANSKLTGWLLKTDMRHALKEHLPHKTGTQLTELFDALDSDEPREMVNYNRLFDDDSDLNQGVFAETIRQQHLNETLDFYQAVEDIVLDQAEKNNTDSCTPAIIGYALRKAHPSMEQEAHEQYIARIFAGAATGKKQAVTLDEGLRLLRSKRAPNMVDVQAALELNSAKGGARATEVRGGRRTLMWGENEEQAAPSTGSVTATRQGSTPSPVPQLPLVPAE